MMMSVLIPSFWLSLIMALPFVLLVLIALLVKISRRDHREIEELQNVLGQPGKGLGDERIRHGLRWNATSQKYVATASISNTGLKAIFRS